MLKAIRKDVYVAYAGSIASILGFVMACAAILLTVDVEKHFDNFGEAGILTDLFSVFINTIVALIVCFCLAFIGLFLDREEEPAFILSNALLSTSVVAVGLIAQSMYVLKALGHQQLFKVQVELKKNKAKKEAVALAEAERSEKWEPVKAIGAQTAEQKAKQKDAWDKTLAAQADAEEKQRLEDLVKLKKPDPPPL